MNKAINRKRFETAIEELIINAKDENFNTVITADEVIKARRLIETNAHSTIDFFILLAAINLLNTAAKLPRYKTLLSYTSIKGNVCRLIHHLLDLNFDKYKIEFYINPIEKCAYVVIFNLQFSFHNINFNEKIRQFINSERNIIKPWKEIRLQKIAGELFRFALEFETE